eukprot:COSAG01_NODE_76576_length_181_cov_137.646341_1_plen_56_part_10
MKQTKLLAQLTLLESFVVSPVCPKKLVIVDFPPNSQAVFRVRVVARSWKLLQRKVL